MAVRVPIEIIMTESTLRTIQKHNLNLVEIACEAIKNEINIKEAQFFNREQALNLKIHC